MRNPRLALVWAAAAVVAVGTGSAAVAAGTGASDAGQVLSQEQVRQELAKNGGPVQPGKPAAKPRSVPKGTQEITFRRGVLGVSCKGNQSKQEYSVSDYPMVYGEDLNDARRAHREVFYDQDPDDLGDITERVVVTYWCKAGKLGHTVKYPNG